LKSRWGSIYIIAIIIYIYIYIKVYFYESRVFEHMRMLHGFCKDFRRFYMDSKRIA